MGSLTAAVSGYIALKLLLRIVVAGNLSRFSYYCWGIGLLTLVGALSGLAGLARLTKLTRLTRLTSAL